MRVMIIAYKAKTGWWYGPRDLEAIDEATKEYDYVLPVCFPCEQREKVEEITNVFEAGKLQPEVAKVFGEMMLEALNFKHG